MWRGVKKLLKVSSSSRRKAIICGTQSTGDTRLSRSDEFAHSLHTISVSHGSVSLSTFVADPCCCRFATRFLYSTLGPPLRRSGNTRQITDPGHLWANVMKDCMWQLTLEVFDHHSLQIDFQKVLFDIELKHIDVQPEASVIMITSMHSSKRVHTRL